MSDAPVLDLNVRLALGGFTLAPELRTDSRRLALFGASGSGKSLTLEVIAGLARPQSGWVRLGGETLFDAAAGHNLPPQLRRVGYVPQRFHLFPHMTVAANVAYALEGHAPRERGRRGARAARRSRVDELLAVVGLEAVADRLPGRISGGQQQRVAFARALAAEPRLLLLDEPFASLDDIVRSRLRRYLAELLRRIGTPTLLVSHNLVEATMLAEQVAVVRAGRIVQLGSGDDIMLRPTDAYVAELAGMTNRLHGRVEEAGPRTMTVRWAGHRLAAPSNGAARGARVTLGVRPEHVLLPPLEPGGRAPVDAAPPGSVRAVITGTLQEGLERRVTLAVGAPSAGAAAGEGSARSADDPDADGATLEMMLSERIFHRYDLGVGRSLVVRLEPHHLWPLARPEDPDAEREAAGASGA